jgi:hypothetical protein
MGDSSSTSFNLAAALVIPHPGVGLSSGGDDDRPESVLAKPDPKRDPVN